MNEIIIIIVRTVQINEERSIKLICEIIILCFELLHFLRNFIKSVITVVDSYETLQYRPVNYVYCSVPPDFKETHILHIYSCHYWHFSYKHTHLNEPFLWLPNGGDILHYINLLTFLYSYFTF